MKRLRLVSIIILLASIALAGMYKVQSMKGVDTMGPIISVGESILEVSIKDDEAVFLEGVTAKDTKDGDVTDTLVVEGISPFTEDGRRIITYAAFDKDNHVCKATRQMKYTDYTEPKINIEEPLEFSADSRVDVLANITAYDCMEGDITGKVRFVQGTGVDTMDVGDTEVKLELTNSIGDTVIQPVMVRVYDTTQYNMSPKIFLNQYIVYTQVGKALKLSKFIEDVSMGREEADVSDVEIDKGDLDYNTPGTYFVKYSLENEDEYVGVAYLTVVVRE